MHFHMHQVRLFCSSDFCSSAGKALHDEAPEQGRPPVENQDGHFGDAKGALRGQSLFVWRMLCSSMRHHLDRDYGSSPMSE